MIVFLINILKNFKMVNVKQDMKDLYVMLIQKIMAN